MEPNTLLSQEQEEFKLLFYFFQLVTCISNYGILPPFFSSSKNSFPSPASSSSSSSNSKLKEEISFFD